MNSVADILDRALSFTTVLSVIVFRRHSRHPRRHQKAAGAPDCGLQQQPHPAAAGWLQPAARAHGARPQ